MQRQHRQNPVESRAECGPALTGIDMSGRHHRHVGLFRTRTTALRGVIGSVAFSVGRVVDDFAVELAQLFLRRLQSRSLTIEKFCLLYTSPSPRDRQKSR